MFGIEKYRKSTTEHSEEENNSSEIYRNYNANNNMNLSSDGYYDKYLKYKAKYLQLKSIEQEGGILELGDGVIFTTKQVALKLRADIKSRLIRTATDFYATLTNQAYIIVNGMKHAELVKKTKEREQAKEEMKVKEKDKKIETKDKKSDTTQVKTESKDKKSEIIEVKIESKDKKSESKDKKLETKEQDGGSKLPEKIPNFNKEKFDSLNENHRKYLRSAVALLFKLNENEIDLVDASFRRSGFPQLK